MTITLNSVVKGVLILISVLLLISFLLEGSVFNTTQYLAMASIFSLAISLYVQKEDEQRTTKKRS